MNRTIKATLCLLAAHSTAGLAQSNEISALELHAAFEANNLRSETLYSGRIYEVTGVFDGAQSGLFGSSVVVTMASGNRYAHAFFGTLAEGESLRATTLDKGDNIRLRCTIDGTVLGTPGGSGCRFVVAAAKAPSLPDKIDNPAPVSPPASIVPLSEVATSEAIDPDYTAFKNGKLNRIEWEQFFAHAVGDEIDGANWWAGQRSLKNPGICFYGPTKAFRKGCDEARALLDPFDVQRKTNPAYRAGWNSY